MIYKEFLNAHTYFFDLIVIVDYYYIINGVHMHGHNAN